MSPSTERSSGHLTRLQSDVLYIVVQHGPVTASDVASHLRISKSSAFGACSRLEKRRVVEATYTDLAPGRRGRGFVVTDLGIAAAEAEGRKLLVDEDVR